MPVTNSFTARLREKFTSQPMAGKPLACKKIHAIGGQAWQVFVIDRNNSKSRLVFGINKDNKKIKLEIEK